MCIRDRYQEKKQQEIDKLSQVYQEMVNRKQNYKEQHDKTLDELEQALKLTPKEFQSKFLFLANQNESANQSLINCYKQKQSKSINNVINIMPKHKKSSDTTKTNQKKKIFAQLQSIEKKTPQSDNQNKNPADSKQNNQKEQDISEQQNKQQNNVEQPTTKQTEQQSTNQPQTCLLYTSPSPRDQA
eukprot:TRINITY_DN14564_c0_g1_i1.p1 TRINITY_DN14564_c0_g1~~TRINITY_DN14564_c0_g1_i1.p1  ORF type:complete len:186 (+),score=51.32 TRINITY_DN14564_c0_g1_i1:124-681(+)